MNIKSTLYARRQKFIKSFKKNFFNIKSTLTSRRQKFLIPYKLFIHEWNEQYTKQAGYDDFFWNLRRTTRKISYYSLILMIKYIAKSQFCFFLIIQRFIGWIKVLIYEVLIFLEFLQSLGCCRVTTYDLIKKKV